MIRRPPAAVTALWEQVRSGDLKGAAAAARARLEKRIGPATRAQLHMVAAACAMRQGAHSEALRELDSGETAAREACAPGLVLRVETWRAELAYFQGRYSTATAIAARVVEPLSRAGDFAHVAFCLRAHIAVLLAQGDYAAIAALAPRALEAARRGGDDYVRVQVLNVLGAVSFDRATSKLAQHARAHLPALDRQETAPMEEDAREALRFFNEARRVAKRGGYEFAAWYVAGNIERLEILLGRPARAVQAIRKRLHVLQKRGATYDEIVTRSNLGWALRELGRYPEALHELDAALLLARRTGTFNVLLEFLYYDRSLVLEALHDLPGARASYRRYLHLAAGRARGNGVDSQPPRNAATRPLEPYFLKRADRFIAEQLGARLSVRSIAAHCGVSDRTLEMAFLDFRGVTPVAHMRNVRLDHAHRALASSDAGVQEIAARYGFGSSTTFALEYRKRFGVPPRVTLHGARRPARPPANKAR